ncbi:hypothetical protein [Niastella sp. OAS944]|uniref:hypothetical protein n=1 Tax=Niastella sp. OAS944 TaxID=2664089 RepID=UPI0034785B96|nr:hypothetical protein [Chitinophagaceae bacterium OAS944]
MGEYIMFTKELIDELAVQGTDLNSKISFENYLMKSGYTPLSTRLFLKEEPLEIIRLSKRNGQTVFRNFADKNDKGTLMDFIRNRSMEDGRVCPNAKVHTFMAAVETATNFLQKHPGRIKPRVLQELASKVVTYKI